MPYSLDNTPVYGASGLKERGMDEQLQRQLKVIQWVLREAGNWTSFEQLLKCYTEELYHQGLPVERVFLGSLTIHPQAAAEALLYDRSEDRLVHRRVSYEDLKRLNKSTKNPMGHLLLVGTPLRARLGQDEALTMVDLIELREAGYTDFLAIPMRIGGQLYAGATYSTRREGGFSPEDIDVLHAAHEALVPFTGFLMRERVQSTLLQAYLGADAGRRVHRGQVRRGDGETIRASVWFCDIRGFTALSSTHERPVVLALINDVFEVVVKEIQERGGQVLKFMGDGILAIFADEADGQHCRHALLAARAVQVGMEELAVKRRGLGLPVARLGIGLHYGDVMYGNIGAPGRLDFTVIGAAVNLAARIEGLCVSLEKSILTSAEFAQEGEATLESCGLHALKGVESPVEVLAVSLE
jgi:adenylate cyclase